MPLRLFALLLFGVFVARPALAKVDFNRDIRPIVSNTCFNCHGPDEASRKAKLRMDVRADAIAKGAIVPGKPEESEAYKRLVATNPDDVMPPPGFGKKLTPEQIATFKKWIEEGAEYKQHWSYEKPQRAAEPKVKNTKWARTPIDKWILARLETVGLTPQPEADKYALARRVALDLTGLPPTPEEADIFVNDKAPDAYERYVDRLLASPAYGEHWARQWLDLARYADSAGYADDPLRTIWAYRDYVVKSFNANKPFDQFTVEQIAGDLLPNPTEEQLIATAFHRNTMTNSEGGTDDEEFRTAAIVDRVNTTASVWMGTSMACAQCHTHKYDPITQREYFQFYAFFNNTADSDKKDEAPFISVLTDEQKTQKTALEKQLAEINQRFDAPSPEIVSAVQRWARDFPIALDWQQLKAEKISAQSGAALTANAENIIAAPGGAKTDIYSIEAPLGANKIAALRLEALPDEALPGKGPGHAGGNFVVTKIRATVLPPDGAPSPKARFVRIELPGQNRLLQLAEVQVWSGGENIAPRGEAKQSSTYADAEARRANDGNTAGEYDKKSVSHTGENDPNPWWEVDLKSEVPIERISIWNRVELPERLQSFRLVLLDAARREVWQKPNNDAPKVSGEYATSGEKAIVFSSAVADFTQSEFAAQDVIVEPTNKNDKTRGWAIAGGQGRAHWLTILAKNAVEAPAGSRLRVTIEQQSPYENHTLGRFRLATTSDPRSGEQLRTPGDVLAALSTPENARDEKQKARITSYFAREIAPELSEARGRLATLQKQIAAMQPTTVPVLRELPENARRKTRVQLRGNYLALGDEVSEGVPSVWHRLPENAPKNRLTLAKWLVEENNPLTARVIANRYWESLFGNGLVRTSEEFGSQGELPTHPELLDWLATELVRLKWDTKAFLKLLVTSAAYKQSSKVTPQASEKDPENYYLSRGPRFRMNAETIRDVALSSSGLLSSKMYGPPVRPLRPNMGLSAAFGGGLDWQTSDGEDRYRRALYTEWRRTSPYPSLVTFDAPNREVCTLRRARTNTPLQALVTMNDPVYIEAAQSLARLMDKAGNTPEAKIHLAFRRVLTRPPTAKETARLVQLFNEARADFAGNEAKAKLLAPSPDLAAWTTVANVLLNLDETLMKR